MTVRQAVEEFCANATVHGLRFMVEKKSSVIQRCAWLIIFLISLSYAAIQVKEAFQCKYS